MADQIAHGPAGRDRAGGVAAAVLALTAAAGAAAVAAFVVPEVLAGRSPEWTASWVPALGVEAALRVDGLSALFALLILGFGAGITVHAARYLREHPLRGRFVAMLALFMAGMLGVSVSDDVILLFVFWEVTTVASFLLVSFDHDRPGARRAAWQALLITGAGGLALFAGLVLLAIAAGTTRISEIAAAEGLADHPLYPAILTLVLIGAFTKSAQAPFHIWLPNAMAAPTPVSAYLHSATMVKAGVFLLARLHPALGGTEAWTAALSLVGGTTMILGAAAALAQTDLKKLLAWTTLSALGSLVMFLGADFAIAIAAAMTFLVVHALYKASMFLAVAAIDKQCGTREIAALGGLWRRMPMTAAALTLAAGSMAGFPPFLGFVGKELKYEGALAVAEEPLPFAVAAVLTNAVMVALAIRIVAGPVFGRMSDAVRVAREAPVALWAPPLVLAALGLAFGAAPDAAGRLLILPATEAVLAVDLEKTFKLWHGVNLPLMLSIGTMALGLALHLGRGPVVRIAGRLDIRGDRSWDALLGAVASGAEAAARVLQPPRLRAHLTVMLCGVFAAPALGLALVAPVAWPDLGAPSAVSTPVAFGAAALAAAGALVAAASRWRVAALGGLGLAGSGSAMLFLMFGAPDVAITQLVADVLLLVLFAAVMAGMPELRPRRGGRARDLAVAVVVGLGAGALALSVAGAPHDAALAEAMRTASVPEALGRNVVNVVLVDFRALDTFGEIAVVALAAIAGAALIRARAPRTVGRR